MRRALVYVITPFADERDMYGSYLLANGFRVVTFEHPAAALAELADGTPDLVIVRFRQAEGWTGATLIEALRRHAGTRLPVIIITTSILDADATAAAAAGCDAYLLLPVRPDTLLAEARRLISTHPL